MNLLNASNNMMNILDFARANGLKVLLNEKNEISIINTTSKVSMVLQEVILSTDKVLNDFVVSEKYSICKYKEKVLCLLTDMVNSDLSINVQDNNDIIISNQDSLVNLNDILQEHILDSFSDISLDLELVEQDGKLLINDKSFKYSKKKGVYKVYKCLDESILLNTSTNQIRVVNKYFKDRIPVVLESIVQK